MVPTSKHNHSPPPDLAANGSGGGGAALACQGCDRLFPPGSSVAASASKANRLVKSVQAARMICEACRKFYCRNFKIIDSIPCTCQSPTPCRRCRLDRCHAAFTRTMVDPRRATHYLRHLITPSPPPQQQTSNDMPCSSSTLDRCPSTSQSSSPHATSYSAHSPNDDAATTSRPSSSASKPTAARLDFSKLPCAVCSCASSGIHFGVVCCEGCKGFFRRSMMGKFRLEYRCKQEPDNNSRVGSLSPSKMQLCPTTSNCRKCRLKRCLNAGMALGDVASMGRLNQKVRSELEIAIAKLEAHHQPPPAQLQQPETPGSLPLMRSQKRRLTQTEDCQRLLQSTDSGYPSSGHASSSSNSVSEQDSPSPSSATTYEPVNRFISNDNVWIIEIAPPGQGYYDDERFENSDKKHPIIYAPMEIAASGTNAEDFFDTSNWLLEPSFTDIPPTLPQPGDFNSLELSLTNHCPDATTVGDLLTFGSNCLLEKACSAVSLLAPINELKLGANRGDDWSVMMRNRASSFDVYLRSISAFFMALPGTNLLTIHDRVTLYSNAFFPVLMAQFSLQFDTETQLPNNFSLDRSSEVMYEIIASCNSWYLLTEYYLRSAGNHFKTAVTNLKEYALFCGFLVFNPAVLAKIDERDKVEAIAKAYERAYFDYLKASKQSSVDGATPSPTSSSANSPATNQSAASGGASELAKLAKLWETRDYFRDSTFVFHSEIRGLPLHCEPFMRVASSLFKDFRDQFVSLIPQSGPKYVKINLVMKNDLLNLN